MGAQTIPTPTLASVLSGRQTPLGDDVDFLAERYLRAEAAAAEAYRAALCVDQPHERAKEELVLLADHLGVADGPHTKLLRGFRHEVRLRHSLSRVLDQERVGKFAYMVRGNRRAKGIFRDLFRWTISYQLQPDADAFLKRFRLPDELQCWYDRCRKIDSVPTLEVIPMSRP